MAVSRWRQDTPDYAVTRTCAPKSPSDPIMLYLAPPANDAALLRCMDDSNALDR